MRVSFLPNVNGDKDNQLNKIVLAIMQELSSEKAFELVNSLLKDDLAAKKLTKGEKLDLPVSTFIIFKLHYLSVGFIFQSEVSSKLNSQDLNLKMLRVYSQRVLKLKEGERAVVANGRVLGPFEEDEVFTEEDFNLLERFSSSSYLEKITKALSKDSEDEEDGKTTFNIP